MRLFSPGLLLGIGVLLACGGGLEREDVEAVIRASEQKYVDDFNEGAIDALGSFYAADAVLLPPNDETVEGRDAIAAYFRSEFAPGTVLDVDVVRVEHSGELAYFVGRYRLDAPGEDGARVRDEGKTMVVFRRQPGGGWLAVADAWSSDLPAG